MSAMAMVAEPTISCSALNVVRFFEDAVLKLALRQLEVWGGGGRELPKHCNCILLPPVERQRTRGSHDL